MNGAIGQALPFAVAISLSPIPIIGVVMMLSTPRARRNGVAFLLGWMLGLGAVGTAVILLSNGAEASEGGSPAEWVNVLKLVLGAALVLAAARTWKKRPRRGEPAEMPKWMDSVDHFGPFLSFGMAILLSAVNPKNLVLIVGAAAGISAAGLCTRQDAIAMGIVVVIATLGPAIPVGVYFVMGKRSRGVLQELRGWMAQNNTTIMAVICLLIGVKLIGDGIAGF